MLLNIIETAGTCTDRTKNMDCPSGRRLTEATGDQHEIFWLMHRLSLAVQRDNATRDLCVEK